MSGPSGSNSTSAIVSSTDPASSSTILPSSSSSSITSDSSSTPPSSSAPPSSSLTSDSSSSSTISTTTASSLPPTTVLRTSVVTQSASNGQSSASSSTVVVTQTFSQSQSSTPPPTSASSSSAPTSSASNGAALQPGQKSSSRGSGLTVGAKTAIAVVIPVVVVAILVIAGLFFWRKRKQRKNEEEQRRKEMEDYGYNPNNDPTLPAVGAASGSEMAEDQSGYRGWGGTTATASNRKASTTLSGGMGGHSDTNSQPGGYHSPGSPSMGTTDGHSGDPLMATRRETMESDGVGALGAAPAAGGNRDMRRGPSNASSSYSAGERSHHSAEAGIPMNDGYGDQYGDGQYYQQGPYDNGAYGAGQPIVRDVQARRNTRIEEPRVRPGQGNSGIAQNF